MLPRQALSLLALLVQKYKYCLLVIDGRRVTGHAAMTGAQFTGFTGTKVQIQTHHDSELACKLFDILSNTGLGSEGTRPGT
jgi:hypothetical protein